MKVIQLYFLLAICFMACNKAPNKIEKEDRAVVKSEKKSSPQLVAKVDTSRNNLYPWLVNYAIDEMLVNQIPPPQGAKRIAVSPNTFADWLRHLPLKNKGAQVHLFNDLLKPNQNVHARVINIDVGKRDLQQCADAVMRLKAEYHFSKKEYRQIHFNYTSGDRVAFDDWRKGRKPIVDGNQVRFSDLSGAINNSYANFKKYLNQIFNYAGTASLTKELSLVALKDMQIGDIFIQGGFPGHAIIVVDMAENEEGERFFMLVQSYMPAQEVHILKNLNAPNLSPWYPLNFDGELHSPEWTFNKNDLKRFD